MSNEEPPEDPHDASPQDGEPDEAAQSRPALQGAAAVWEDLRNESWRPSAWWRVFRDAYFTFDRRTLGFARVMLGFLLLMDLCHRGAAWMDMYSSIGVLPTQFNLQRPQAYGAFSIFNAFSTPIELRALWGVMFVTFFCLLIGYKTKLCQILSVIFVTGMNGRILLIENGGYVVHNLLTMWTAFLPMGDRFSVDAMLASMKRQRETTAQELNDRADLIPAEKAKPHVTLLGLVLFIQLAAIYYFNAIHKTGPAWKNGTAVHYVLYVDRMVTPIVGHTRDHIPNFLIIAMTKVTMICESMIPVVLLQPLARTWTRRVAIVMINLLHLGFGTAMVLGPFAWSCCVFSTLLFSADDWDLAAATMRREHRARTVLFDPRSGAALFVCRILKRLDRYELLTFAERDGLPLGIAVERSGERVERVAILPDLIAALPLGPIPAAALRLPGVRHAAGVLLGLAESRDLSRTFGLPVGKSKPAPAGPSRLRRGARYALGSLREIGIALMFAGAINQALTELWVINRRIKVPQPEPLRILAHKMRFLQGWFMFSPNPVMDDGTIVVDAVTIDGRHVDPFTGKEPNFDLLNAKSLALTQIWCDYFNRIQLPGNTAYREPMKDYMYRLPQRTGRPGDAIVSGDVYWVKDMNPRWNDTKSYGYERAKLFSFENPATRAQATK